MNINRPLFRLFLVTLLFSAGCKKFIEPPTPPPVPPAPPITDLNWQFETTPVWADEFSTDGNPDLNKWSYNVGGNGWGNNQLEYNTDGGRNATVTGGNLVITAKKEAFLGNNYTSARMITYGKADWLYGRFEVKAKLPKGRGSWPAIWMLPTESVYGIWPKSGEIDIMEHVGFDQDVVHWTIHCEEYNPERLIQKTFSQAVPGATDDFHIYRVDWTPFAIRFYLDDTKVYEYTNPNGGYTKWPFNRNFYLILNVAVGGTWGGQQGVDDTAFPTSMLVDYVRVYKMIPK